MEKFIEPGLLQDNADKVEEMAYVIPLTEEEMTASKDLYANKSIVLAKIEDIEQERRSEYKEKVSPLKLEKNRILSEIKTGVRDCHGQVFLLSDQKEGIMCYYSDNGSLINHRPLTQDERQLRISPAVNG